MDTQKLKAAHKVLERFRDYMQDEARVLAVLGHGAYAIENKLVEVAPEFKPILKDLQKNHSHSICTLSGWYLGSF